MVKIEGGAWIAATVEYLTTRGVPVCGHVGLTPQSVHMLGGYKVQGRTDAAADALIGDAQALARAGASLVVVECVPRDLGARVTREAGVPVIGIGAGPDCSGQVLVVYDALGMQPGKAARFVRNFIPATTASRPRSPPMSGRSRTARSPRRSTASDAGPDPTRGTASC